MARRELLLILFERGGSLSRAFSTALFSSGMAGSAGTSFVAGAAFLAGAFFFSAVFFLAGVCILLYSVRKRVWCYDIPIVSVGLLFSKNVSGLSK